jgi:hypothetical protein
MDKDREQKILESLYDRLFDAVTYAPEGKSAPWHKDTTFIQMAKNLVLDPDDFKNVLSPVNPNGDMKTAAAFSEMVDALPNTDAAWSDSGKKVSDVYQMIVNEANSDSEINPKQQETYDKAYKFLNTEIETEDYEGNKKTRTDPSAIAIAYDESEAAYITAVGGYRTAFNGYDLDKIEDQRAWNAVAPGLQLNVDQSWNKWNRAGKAEVEQAQNALKSSINDAVRYVIGESQKLVNDQHKLAPLTPAGSQWLPSFALPTSWARPDSQASKLTFKSAYLNETASSSATSYSASASGGWGLWHASAGVSGSHEESKSHMDAENLTLEAELINVSIKRPWFNPLLLTMNQWWLSGQKRGYISNANATDLQGVMPIVPTGFVVARNVKITADFSEQDKSFVSNAISTKASGGWGPFSVSGSYSHSSSKSEFHAKFDGGTLELPGLQLIAWISSIMPISPPMDSK